MKKVKKGDEEERRRRTSRAQDRNLESATIFLRTPTDAVLTSLGHSFTIVSDFKKKERKTVSTIASKLD